MENYADRKLGSVCINVLTRVSNSLQKWEMAKSLRIEGDQKAPVCRIVRLC